MARQLLVLIRRGLDAAGSSRCRCGGSGPPLEQRERQLFVWAARLERRPSPPRHHPMERRVAAARSEINVHAASDSVVGGGLRRRASPPIRLAASSSASKSTVSQWAGKIRPVHCRVGVGLNGNYGTRQVPSGQWATKCQHHGG